MAQPQHRPHDRRRSFQDKEDNNLLTTGLWKYEWFATASITTNNTAAAAPTTGATGSEETSAPPQAQGLGSGLLARTVARVAPQKEPIVPDEKPDPKDEQAESLRASTASELSCYV